MKILVDSFEYKSWHEVGHATVCLYLGGDVELIEFLDGDLRGHARTCCVVAPEIEKIVACGGFAAEFLLLNNGYAELGLGDDRDISRVLFHNATNDLQDFWGRELGRDEACSEEEGREFMHHAIGRDGHGGLIPLFTLHFPRMQELVRELCEAKRVEGSKIKKILRIGLFR